MAGNTAATSGGGIDCSGSGVELANTILWDNQAAVGPEAALRNTSTMTIGHSEVMGGPSSVNVESGSTFSPRSARTSSARASTWKGTPQKAAP